MKRIKFYGTWKYKQITKSSLEDYTSFNQQEKTCRRVDFAAPANHWVKSKSEKLEKYLDLVRELKNVLEPEDDGDTSHSLDFWNSLQVTGKLSGETEHKRKNWNHPEHRTTKID